MERARSIYDHVIEKLRYAKYGSGWAIGDAVYTCDARSGNCSDFHAYFISLVRAVGIPVRFAIGTPPHAGPISLADNTPTFAPC